MMRLCVCVWFIVLMCVPNWCKADNIDIDFSTDDTTWVVNYLYSSKDDTFDVDLIIPKKIPVEYIEYKYVRVSWGHDNKYSDNITLPLKSDSILKYPYPKGKCFLTVEYHLDEPTKDDVKGDLNVYFCVFNQDLEGSIAMEEGEGEFGCLEDGKDTFYFHMEGHENNPPGTKYELNVSSSAPRVEEGEIPDVEADDFWKVSQYPEFIEDSARVVFIEGTGIHGADASFRVTYQGLGSQIVKYYNTHKIPIEVYQKPNLNGIFSYVDSLADWQMDNLDEIEKFQRMDVCAYDILSELKYEEDVNEKYQYLGSPSYKYRLDFDVDYYRKDSINQLNWEEVTTDPEMVDTTNMIFKYPGLYKINMIASNLCGADTLCTDLIKGRDEKRHIFVHQCGENVILCNEDTICRTTEGEQIITFVDYGKLFKWDTPPHYDFYVIHTSDNKIDTIKNFDIHEKLYYKGIEEIEPISTGFECDSTLLKIKLEHSGVYEIRLTRSSFSDTEKTYTHIVRIGGKPKLSMDFLQKYIREGDTVKLSKDYLKTCDTLNFILPQNEKKHLDSNYMSVDSILWVFQKGEEKNLKKDTILQYQDPELSYKFDSIGDKPNCIQLKARNFCGWNELNALKLFTNETPRMILWRDSIETNENLCIGIDYKYHWVGNILNKYSIRGMWTTDVVANDKDLVDGSVVDFSAKNVDNESLEEFGVVRFKGAKKRVEEVFYIFNGENNDCLQKLEDTVYLSDSRIKINKMDTLKQWEPNDYLFTKAGIDTNDLEGKITWRNLNEENGGSLTKPNSLEGQYTLSNSDKELDTLFFELSGRSKCDQELKDTLIVIVPQPILNASVDTICKGVAYTLWGENKTYGKFIEESTLKWELLVDENSVSLGELSKNTGIDVTYTPSEIAFQADTVKIEVRAWHQYRTAPLPKDPDKIDTIFLKVNPTPQHIFPDTLYLKAGGEEGSRKIYYDNIKRYKDEISNSNAANGIAEWTRARVSGEGINSSSTADYYYIGTPPGDENYATGLEVEYTPLKGCKTSLKDTVVFIGVVPPIAVLGDTVQICAGEIDPILFSHEIIARDKYTKIVNLVSDGDGKFNSDTTAYTPTKNDNISEFTLEVIKRVPLYTGSTDTLEYKDDTTRIVETMKKPSFSFEKDGEELAYDTICRLEEKYHYIGDIAGGYEKNDFTIRENDRLTGDFSSGFTLTEGEFEAELVIYLDQGTCTKWNDITDTLHITRLKKMVGNFRVNDICKEQQLSIEVERVDPLNKGYSWMSDDVTIGDISNYTPLVVGKDSILMLIQPPRKCPVDTITKSFEVFAKPSLTIQNPPTVICEKGRVTINFDKTQVSPISWKVGNRVFATTTTKLTVDYTYNKSDVVDGKIKIIGEGTAETPCSGPISCLLELIEQKNPVINPMDNIFVCQGDTLELKGLVTLQNASNIEWGLNGFLVK